MNDMPVGVISPGMGLRGNMRAGCNEKRKSRGIRGSRREEEKRAPRNTGDKTVCGKREKRLAGRVTGTAAGEKSPRGPDPGTSGRVAPESPIPGTGSGVPLEIPATTELSCEHPLGLWLLPLRQLCSLSLDKNLCRAS